MRRRSTILLTGFGPFPGVQENASALLVPKLAHLAARRFPGHRVVARILPTEWDAAPPYLFQIYEREHPDLALHFGVSERATGFVIETQARNVRGAMADAKGLMPATACVAADGPAMLASRVPAEEVVTRLLGLGVPAKVSDDAGTYLCNTVLYEGLVAAGKRRAGMTVGFVHIPSRVEGMRAAADGVLDWERTLQGGLEIIRACLGRPPSARVKRR